MKGATICATLAIRFTPPITTMPMSKATAPPTMAGLILKVLAKERAMPLDCTGGMKKPAAKTAVTANTTASHLLCKPFSI